MKFFFLTPNLINLRTRISLLKNLFENFLPIFIAEFFVQFFNQIFRKFLFIKQVSKFIFDNFTHAIRNVETGAEILVARINNLLHIFGKAINIPEPHWVF